MSTVVAKQILKLQWSVIHSMYDNNAMPKEADLGTSIIVDN